MRKHINLLRRVLNIIYAHLSRTGILNESFFLELTIIIWLILRIQDKKNNLHYTNCFNEEKFFFQKILLRRNFFAFQLEASKKGNYKQMWSKNVQKPM